MPTTCDDHDLLQRIDERVKDIHDKIATADVPARCARHDVQHEAHAARLKVLETRFWWLISVAVGGLIVGGVGLLFHR